jgi:hypothetical protein
LSPLELSEVEFGGVRLRSKEPLHLQPRILEDTPHFLNVEKARFGLDAFAGTVGELIDEVAEDLVVVWKEYALARDSELSPNARELKRHLLEAFEELPIAS